MVYSRILHLQIGERRNRQNLERGTEISYNLRPYLLENLGLTKAVKSLLNKVAETGKKKSSNRTRRR